MYSAIARNKRNTWFILTGFVIVLGLLGLLAGWLAGNNWWITAFILVFAAGYATFQYFMAGREALALAGAFPVTKGDAPRYHRIVENLCITTGTPMPKLYVVEDPAPNAFATGRNPQHAAIAVTTGLLDKMNRVELEGVVAHELSHIKNYDILVSTLAVTLVGAVALLSDMAIRTMWWNGGRVRRQGDRDNGANPLALVGFAMLIIAPLAAKAMQAAISRNRETLADVSAVQMTRYPPGLISALEKLQADTTVTHSASTATAHLWIEQPMSGVGDGGKLKKSHSMFDTHPPLDERIALLREL